MDKNAIKKYAVWARNELIARVTQKAQQYGITADDIVDANADSINGNLLTATEKKQRQALIKKIETEGFEQVMEEVAYTWFNRFTALRFMEVNNYLPSHVRVFTNDDNEFKPQILAEAINLELDGLDMDKVFELKDANKDEELYKYLLIVQCNALNDILPRMFQKIADYTELLLPDNLLRDGSAIEQMVSCIPEIDWTEQVEIIGWLYQFYIAEPKDVLINAKKRYKREDIPFVTQIFTPDWIVKYMVQNSLGKYWCDMYENIDTANWDYYVGCMNPNKKIEKVQIEDIKCIDPCAGSGHIMCYLFDFLMMLYEGQGYSNTEAVSNIIKYNLWGLDLDDRAVQLSYFSIMMKARQYDRRFFTRKLQPNVYVVCNSLGVDEHVIDYFANSEELKIEVNSLVDRLKDASELGSIIDCSDIKIDMIRSRLNELSGDISLYSSFINNDIADMLSVAVALSQKYNVVVTNPPYMNATNMPDVLKKYVAKSYADFKGDLFSVFTKRTSEMCRENGYVGLLMPYVWMFLSSYEKMREWVNSSMDINSLVQLEYNAFEAACVPVAALTMCNNSEHSLGDYIKLSEFRGAENQGPKTLEAISNEECGYRFKASQDDFEKLPGSPIAYWLNKNTYSMYSDNLTMGDIAHPKVGMQTSNNDKYLRLWFEVDYSEFEGSSMKKKWIKYLKGGSYRKWYGNLDYLLFYNYSPNYILEQKNARVLDENFLTKKKCTWTDLTSGSNSFRIAPDDTFYDISGHCFFPSEADQLWLLGYSNTKVFSNMLKVFNSTMHCQVGDVAKVVVPSMSDEDKQYISSIVEENIRISKNDWDSFEYSWDFKKHPLIGKKGKIESAFIEWEKICENNFETLKSNEEKLNEFFYNKYGLLEDPGVKEEDVTIRKADLEREIKSLISYAVGCMFGRYSLEKEGICYAGGDWNPVCDIFAPDDDNIIPICDDEYFEDDLANRFVDFIDLTYGHEFLEDNLKYIAQVLGGSGTPREIIRSYFLNEYFKDHCALYSITGSGRRPIYWLFDSGKKNGFKCLVYMHRYRPDTLARIRTDYVHEQQSRYRTIINELEQKTTNISSSEKVKISKQLKKIVDQSEELRLYEEKIHHLADQMIEINLDDGVKNNYAIFQSVLAKIK